MRKAISLVLSLLFFVTAAHTTRAVEMTWEFSVQVSATIQASPAQITLHWPQDQYTQPNSYTVYRKGPGDASWGSGINLPGTTTSYVDKNVTAGTAYEYQVVKVSSQYTGYGYVYSGINLPMSESRGKLLLVIDNTHASALATELNQLHQNLVGDGWSVIRLSVNRNDTPAKVKQLIKAQYQADPANVKCVFLFGHVPVPYSGNIVPDGHTPDHQGAWPADAYYGDMDGSWTDTTVNNPSGQYQARNSNIPGDGKFDQNTLPSPIELMVGRVDLADMPGALWTGGPATFPSELNLLKNYLNKDHRYRTKQIDVPRRGVVGDFFGVRNGEAFAASGWRNFSAMFGADKVASTPQAGTWANQLANTPYLWAYGGGAGSFGSISGLGNTGDYSTLLTTEMYTKDIKAVFTMLFGSWLGDWDSPDNIMRGVLALPSYGLASAWSGRPHWFLHHMAMGEPIGFGARLTQNNGANGLYKNQVNTGAGMVHVALMGDPTLRLHVVAPPSDVRAVNNGTSMNVSWRPSNEQVLGYHVYRAGANGVFTRATSSPVTGTAYTDPTPAGTTNYMVRAMKLETSGSGAYYNLSVGAFQNAIGNSSGGTSGDTGSGSTGGTTNNVPGTNVPNATLVNWVDDAVPTGGVLGSSGGDAWNWITTNPAPNSGTRARLSNLAPGLHEHFFYSASQTLTVNPGDNLFAYVYLDPSNPPTEVMLQWLSDSWEHRAYWGANQINNGIANTPSRAYAGALPAAGRWVLLQVPASQVGLEGKVVHGMAFSLYGGRAAWDNAGKASGTITNNPGGDNNGGDPGTNPGDTGDPGSGTVTNTTGLTIANPVVWVDDELPAGAITGADGGDAWTWISSSPAPFSGSKATQSKVLPGLHQYYFYGARQGMNVGSGDVLFAYAYLDPSNPPTELMLQWNDGSWQHRAYWGANQIDYGTPNTPGRVYMGPLPEKGKWVLLAVPAKSVDLEGATVTGIAFSQYGGRVAWDKAGKGSGLVTGNPGDGNDGGNNGGNDGGTNDPGSGTVTNGLSLINPVSWVDDELPAGAITGADGGDAWTWISSSPAPFSGSKATQSKVLPGLHQYYFYGARQGMNVGSGDVLFAYAYLDPSNPPTELMLQWNDGSWQHRAYWGANQIDYGTPNTPGRVYMGPLPEKGKWVLLTVPAKSVDLEGATVTGIAFTQYGGRVAWDKAGKASGVTTDPNPGDPGTDPGNGGGSGTNNPAATNYIAYVDEMLPAGAVSGAEGGDSWNWVSSGLGAPYSGSKYTLSAAVNGQHQYYFTDATQTLSVREGDVLCAAVYLDPANPPQEIMLQWNNGSWQHRAYWGANLIDYGATNTPGRVYMGPLPAKGKWVLLQVPASKLDLEGSTVSGMAFSQYGGRVAWDYAGKFSAYPDGNGTDPGDGGDGDPGNGTDPGDGTDPGNGTDPGTNTPSWGTNTYVGHLPGISVVDYVTPELPKVGDHDTKIITPTLLELKLINTAPQGSSKVTAWDLVNNDQFKAPPVSAFTVTVNGARVDVSTVGFKRRPLYAPLLYDLRIESSLYLQLSRPISDNQVVEIKNSSGLWAGNMRFTAKMDPLRFSPAVHVNQEGYMPNFAKKAMVGYYAGSLGEVNIPASAGFKIVNANTGQQVHQGTLSQRPESGWSYSPQPYQKVYEADFTGFNTPGEYRLVVPGMGGSLPFVIHGGVAMSFARAYALGIYHQRCGTATEMPATRFTHDACHIAHARVPATVAGFDWTWKTIADYAKNVNAAQTAPALTSPQNQRFPFVNKGPLDVSGGHHDAGDYSKYTSNSGHLIHYLMFAVDSLPGVAELDNLGIPESGDGISDVLQEAKWEADYLAKIQDADGGFYFLVYPEGREYETDVVPEKGDPQVVWPKTMSVTAAGVAALAQCATSPAFKKAYPQVAANYLAKAKLGWQFLMNAINRYGRTGGYQKITHYADNFVDNDELAWAATQMYLATGDESIHQQLKAWFNPADPATWHYGWWHLPECYGHAIRSYAFAAKSGRIAASKLDPAYLKKCQDEIVASANNMLTFSRHSAYGTSFPDQTKAVRAAGWYFSTDQAFDLAVAYAMTPQQDYMTAMLANMNYEGGCNPVNVTYVTGLGWKRQREVVSQWAYNDTRVLPPSGTPVGNVGATFSYLWYYGGVLDALSFPASGAPTAPYPFYDRWGDSWTVQNEMVVLNQARSLGTLSFLAAQTSYKTQPWKPLAGATIKVPSGVPPLDQPVTVSLEAPGIDLSNARITWEARDQEPFFGHTFTFSPKTSGIQWVEAEAKLPDGRRVFAKASFKANSPNVVWVNDALPAGAVTGADGGDSWAWVGSNPAPHSGSKSHQSALAAGAHQHYFHSASSTLPLESGDVLYAWVYLDPANPPSEIMLQWNDGSWDHRAYWGANNLDYGANAAPSRAYMGPLPAAGQWVELKVPAKTVGLEGKTVNGMAFSAFGGKVSWDTAGRLSTN